MMKEDRSMRRSPLRPASDLLRRVLLTAMLSALTAPHLLANEAGTEAALVATGVLTAVCVFVVFFAVFVLNGDIEPVVSFLRKVWAHVVPQESEDVAEMDDDFDGIRELDNRIPPWFNYLFVGTVIFALIYWVDYHVVGSSPLPEAEYQQELVQADLLRRLRIAGEGEVNEATLVVLADKPSLSAGQDQYVKYCLTCHGARGEGIVGPNLTDEYWIHGGGIKNVYATVKNGVPAKGMISWKLVFTPKEIQQISSYVLSLQGTNPPNPKKPEGALYIEPVASASEPARNVKR